MVDTETPPDAFPMALQDSLLKTSGSAQWKLVFSDEFNDNTIDARKWNVENSSRKRTDIMLLANEQQVEEKEGNVFIYYRKLMTEDTTYLAGRFNSKGKYAPTYGFIETRMHIVKPNGYQMAFWMMP